MGWWEKFNKWADEPCLAVRIERRIEIQGEEAAQVKELIEENKRLKQQLGARKAKAIEAKCKLIE